MLGAVKAGRHSAWDPIRMHNAFKLFLPIAYILVVLTSYQGSRGRLSNQHGLEALFHLCCSGT